MVETQTMEKAKQIRSVSHKFDDTYREWKKGTEKAFKGLQDIGEKVYKIEIDLDEMVKWCKNQKQPLDSTARAEFVSMKVKEHHESLVSLRSKC